MSDQNPHRCLGTSRTGELPCAAKPMKPSSVWGWVIRRSGVLPWLCRCARLSSEADRPCDTQTQSEDSDGTETLLPASHHHSPKDSICHGSFVYTC